MVIVARFVQSPIWFSSRLRERAWTHPAKAGPENPFVPARRPFSHRGSPLAGIPDPWRLTTGQTAERCRQRDAAGSNQSTGFARPFSGSRRHPVIQIAFACRSPFLASRARLLLPICRPAPCGPRCCCAAASSGRTKTASAARSGGRTLPPR